jgi:6-phosphogluconolactonase
MKIEVLADADAVAARGADIIALDARIAVALRARFVMAVSGGHTPWATLRLLAAMNVPWADVHLLQVDERVAPPGDADRNLTHIEECLLSQAPCGAAQMHAMPVAGDDLAAAAAAYADTLHAVAGAPPILDLVHLGLGADGHTASLLPNDAVLGAVGDVALAGPYRGRLRMTLTYGALNRARRILWLVTGRDKAPMLARLVAGDRSIPAGAVCREHALLLADSAAASLL